VAWHGGACVGPGEVEDVGAVEALADGEVLAGAEALVDVAAVADVEDGPDDAGPLAAEEQAATVRQPVTISPVLVGHLMVRFPPFATLP
jgi:hypothetical protein